MSFDPFVIDSAARNLMHGLIKFRFYAFTN